MPSQRQLEFLEIQEDYIKEEQANLKRELLRAQEEVKRIQSVPLVIGQFLEMVDASNGIVGSTTGSNYYVRILSTLNRELLKPSASVALHRHSNALVDILPPEADSSISLLGENEKPNVSYQVHMGIPQLLPPMLLHAWPRTSHAPPHARTRTLTCIAPHAHLQDIGGYDIQKQEIREAVELPLTHAGLYQQLGIDPPRGVLLYGPPGAGEWSCGVPLGLWGLFMFCVMGVCAHMHEVKDGKPFRWGEHQQHSMGSPNRQGTPISEARA